MQIRPQKSSLFALVTASLAVAACATQIGTRGPSSASAGQAKLAETGYYGLPIPPPSGWTFQRLRAVLVESGSSTVAEFLTALKKADPGFFRFSAYVYATNSIQGASLRDPRAVIYASDAGVVLTFNGDPSQDGYASVETLEFDRAFGYRFREIHFPGDRKDAAMGDEEIAEDLGFARISKPNPQTCTACHDPDGRGVPRPRWQSYPRWPGAYASDDDLITRPEAAAALRYDAYWKAHARYAKVLTDRNPPGEVFFMYNDPKINPNYHPSGRPHLPQPPGWTFKRNAALNERFSWQMSQRMIDDVRALGPHALDVLGKAVECSYGEIHNFSAGVFGPLVGRPLQAG